MTDLRVLVTPVHPEATIPSYAHWDDAGADLATTEDITLNPGERVLVGTGISVAIPAGYAGFVHPRSGLAARSGLSIVNCVGVIDAGYRGEIKVCLINTDPSTPIHLNKGDLVAQLVIQAVVSAIFVETETLPDSERGTGGYGSSGGVASWVED
ncbi:MAG: dUTP diphosphatase [Propionibacteriaceae bacterium]|jgi:dUTP pyrophosphatase|nr:dUTP diphosphatase [Propionibacteriaceae bacterium]